MTGNKELVQSLPLSSEARGCHQGSNNGAVTTNFSSVVFTKTPQNLVTRSGFYFILSLEFQFQQINQPSRVLLMTFFN